MFFFLVGASGWNGRWTDGSGQPALTHIIFSHTSVCLFHLSASSLWLLSYLCVPVACAARVPNTHSVPNVVCLFGSFSKRSSGWLGMVQEYHQPYSFLLYRISHCHEASCCTETVVGEETVLQTLLEPRGGSFLTQPHSGAGLSPAHCHASGFHKPLVAVHGSRLEVAPR